MFKKTLSLLVILYLSSVNAFATERSVSLALTSNYVFRGLTKTADKAAIQARYEVMQTKDTGWYAGLFASNVSKGLEADVYGGLRAAFGRNKAYMIDLGAIEYMYTDSSNDFSHEFYAGLSYEDYTYVKYFFGENETRYLDLGISFEVLGSLNLDLHFGEKFNYPGNSNINDISVSLRKDFDNVKLSGTVTYEDANKETEAFVTLGIEF
jgi:uncharacterized protein (TIGR02001 family)